MIIRGKDIIEFQKEFGFSSKEIIVRLGIKSKTYYRIIHNNYKLNLGKAAFISWKQELNQKKFETAEQFYFDKANNAAAELSKISEEASRLEKRKVEILSGLSAPEKDAVITILMFKGNSEV